ncbi:MAG: 23S rRNA pseudouridine2457 synthase [Flavobacteriales bacterium]|jgi:23S rRNA pseudouridine2457 synthase
MLTKHRHFVSHKPARMISQFVGNGKRRARYLGELFDFPEGTMAIGRLDEKSEGLLLLTTDGKESARICGKHIEKEYYAQVDGIIDQEAVSKLNAGVEIGLEGAKYTTLPSICRLIDSPEELNLGQVKIRDDRHGPTSWVSVIVKEGKYRQVRKMTAAVGFPTLRLVRVRIGVVNLQTLPSAAVIEVSSFDQDH